MNGQFLIAGCFHIRLVNILFVWPQHLMDYFYKPIFNFDLTENWKKWITFDKSIEITFGFHSWQ